MCRKLWALVIVSGFLAGSWVWADETYTIKIKHDAKGDVSHSEKHEVEENTSKVVGPDGKVINEQAQKKLKTAIYSETILETDKGKRKAIRLSRRYEKAEVVADGKTKTLPYEGKTVLIEKKDGKYRFRIEGGEELTGQDALELTKEFSKGRDEGPDPEETLLPKQPVKLNEAWKMDIKEFAKLFEKGAEGMKLDIAKSSGTGKLVRAYKKDGHQFGVIEIRMEFPFSGSLPVGGNNKARLEAGSKLKMIGTMDGCIDGTSNAEKSEFAMNFEILATFKGPDGNDYKMNITSSDREKSSTRDLTKK